MTSIATPPTVLEGESVTDPSEGHGELPGHVAIIMDGNRRWARERGLPEAQGHAAGVEAIRPIVERSVERGVKVLSIYAFSRENWQRADHEVRTLFSLLEGAIRDETPRLREQGVRVRLLGRIDELGAGTRASIEDALALTADTPMLGRRLRDVRNRFALPEGLTMANLPPEPNPEGRPASALASYVASRHDASLTWRDVDWLRSISGMPVIVKGILRGDDAARAVAEGAEGVWVSNHGARQLDGVAATIEALPEVVDAVGGRVPVLLDGGVRWGTDVLKALALGANAVMVGRPLLWGLAAGGEDGAARVLSLLREELSTAMALAGCSSVGDIPRDLVRRRTR